MLSTVKVGNGAVESSMNAERQAFINSLSNKSLNSAVNMKSPLSEML